MGFFIGCISNLAVTSEDLYRCLAEHTADGIIVSDAEGVVTYCNPAMARAAGRPPEELVGQSLHSVVECTCGDTRDGAAEAAAKLVIATEDNAEIHNGVVVCHSGMDLAMPLSHIAISKNGKKGAGHITVV